ncbi:hypothetical protein K449DRAFT_48347 [Hypoxylon sp. EC38]|nr:hypothetical protein K449DRAFT_48347 [Hypoxylon sp. EC38]
MTIGGRSVTPRLHHQTASTSISDEVRTPNRPSSQVTSVKAKGSSLWWLAVFLSLFLLPLPTSISTSTSTSIYPPDPTYLCLQNFFHLFSLLRPATSILVQCSAKLRAQCTSSAIGPLLLQLRS